MLRCLLAIFIGGGCGSVLRYCVQYLLHERIAPYNFPWSTFTVNIIGSAMIGAFYVFSDKFGWSAEVRMLLTAGLCGGFTTFSTYSYDMLCLLRSGHILMFTLYSSVSIILGILATWAGTILAR